MTHRNSPLTPEGRRRLVERVVSDGRPIAHVATEGGVSRQTLSKWVNRFNLAGEEGLEDMSTCRGRLHTSFWVTRSSPAVKTRHVYLTPPLGVGPRLQGFVVKWRQTQGQVSPPSWEAFVVSVDDRYDEGPRIQWVPAVYLDPVMSERPQNDEDAAHP